MKTSILIVVASIHFTGSFYNQSALSSVLSQFESTLVAPRKRQADKIASGPVPGSTTPLGSTAPAPLPASGSTPAAPTKESEQTQENEQTQESKQTQENEQMKESEQTQEIEQMEEIEQTQESKQMTMSEQTVANNAMAVEQVSKDNVNGTESETAVVDEETISSTATSTSSTSTSSTISTTASSTTPSTSSTSTSSTSTMTTSKADQTRLLHLSQAKSGASGWSFKDTLLGLHLGTGLWLLILTGVSTYFVGATTLLWVRLEALRRARAPPPPAVDV